MSTSYRVNALYLFDLTISGLSSTGSENGIRYGDSVHGTSSGIFPRMYLNLYRYFGLDWNPYSFVSDELWPAPDRNTNEGWLYYGGTATNFKGNGVDGIVRVSRIGIPTFIGYRNGNVDKFGDAAPVLGTYNTTETYADHLSLTSTKTMIEFAGGVPWTTAEIRTYLGQDPDTGAWTPGSNRTYYKNVNYVTLLSLSTSGRRQLNMINSFYTDFFTGKLTYNLV